MQSNRSAASYNGPWQRSLRQPGGNVVFELENHFNLFDLALYSGRIRWFRTLCSTPNQSYKMRYAYMLLLGIRVARPGSWQIETVRIYPCW
jgi:hypothetical protein